jgi:hypothetical protein
MTVTTNAQGQAKFTMTFTTGVSAGQFITATATDANNNTSQFSKCVRVGHGDSDGSDDDDYHDKGKPEASRNKGEGGDIIQALSQPKEMTAVGHLATRDNKPAQAGAGGLPGGWQASSLGEKTDVQFPFVGFFSSHDPASPGLKLAVDPESDLTR